MGEFLTTEANIAAPDTGVAVVELSPQDRDRLLSRFTWTQVNNSPWGEWSATSDGKPPLYEGIPWYQDISISRERASASIRLKSRAKSSLPRRRRALEKRSVERAALMTAHRESVP